jgi:hypothetical protein
LVGFGSPWLSSWSLGHETHDRFSTIQSFESGSFYARASSIFEHEVLGAVITSTLRKIQHWFFLSDFDGGSFSGQFTVMEPAQSGCAAWLGGFSSVVCFMDSTCDMTISWPNTALEPTATAP